MWEEAAKLGLQLFFSWLAQQNLTEEQEKQLLDLEREKFKANLSKPLPDV